MRRRRQQGSVLIIVLLVLATAAYLALESARTLRIDYTGAAAQRLNASGDSLLRSGLTVAEEALLDDLRGGSQVDHLFESWARIGSFYKSISGKLQSGDLEGVITAEDSRINLNLLLSGGQGEALQGIFLRLMAALAQAQGVDMDVSRYLTSIKIWLGAKDTPGDATWYAAQDPGYLPRRGAFQTPEELLLVRSGLSADQYRGLLYGVRGVPGLLDFVTVWGTGYINVNTAPKAIVAAICPDTALREQYVEAVMAYRNNGANIFSTPWYREIARRLGVDMTKFPDKTLDVKSTVFRVSLAADIGAGVLRSTSIVQRYSACKLLFQTIY